VVLFVALIVLVALSLSGVALVRSVESTTLVAGNLALKQSALLGSDRGIQAAYDWLLLNRTTLASSNPGQGYSAAKPTPEPNWELDSAWGSAINLGTDAASNTVYYVIHRMCLLPDTPHSNGTCATETAVQGGTNVVSQGDSNSSDSASYSKPERAIYRITTRTVGPKNATTVTQTMVAIEI
jgi:Tfp pilus assembly protein PilX